MYTKKGAEARAFIFGLNRLMGLSQASFGLPCLRGGIL